MSLVAGQYMCSFKLTPLSSLSAYLYVFMIWIMNFGDYYGNWFFIWNWYQCWVFVLLRCSKFKTESTVIIEARSDCGIFSTVLLEEVG